MRVFVPTYNLAFLGSILEWLVGVVKRIFILEKVKIRWTYIIQLIEWTSLLHILRSKYCSCLGAILGRWACKFWWDSGGVLNFLQCLLHSRLNNFAWELLEGISKCVILEQVLSIDTISKWDLNMIVLFLILDYDRIFGFLLLVCTIFDWGISSRVCGTSVISLRS